MPSFNKVMLMGNLTRDPEVRYTPKGTAVASVDIAVNRVWSTETGEKKEEVTFVSCTAWGKQAETLGQYVSKGKPLFIEGRLKLDQWDDKETGQKRSKLAVVIESFQFIGGRAPDDTAQPAPADDVDQTRQQRAGPSHRPPPPKADREELPLGGARGDEDSIPF